MQTKTTPHRSGCGRHPRLALVAAGCGGSGKNSTGVSPVRTRPNRRPSSARAAPSSRRSSSAVVHVPPSPCGARRDQYLQRHRQRRRDRADHRPHRRLRRKRCPALARPAQGLPRCVQTPVGARGDVCLLQPSRPGEPLRLSGPVIANMYLGQIKNWNDPRSRTSTPARTCRDPDQPCPSRGRRGDTLRLHRLPLPRQPGVEGEGRRRNLGQLADRHRRAEELRRPPRCRARPAPSAMSRSGTPSGRSSHTPTSRTRPARSSRPPRRRSPLPRRQHASAKDSSASIVDPPAAANSQRLPDLDLHLRDRPEAARRSSPRSSRSSTTPSPKASRVHRLFSSQPLPKQSSA